MFLLPPPGFVPAEEVESAFFFKMNVVDRRVSLPENRLGVRGLSVSIASMIQKGTGDRPNWYLSLILPRRRTFRGYEETQNLACCKSRQ